MKNKATILFTILILVLTLINVMLLSSGNRLLVFISSIFILVVFFLILTIFHKAYSNLTNKIHPFSILLIAYIILITNIILQISKVYSIEWAFLGFIVCAIIFYDFKIDSRFLILPALILLAYIPFLLTGKYNSIAETTAVYVYYFLVTGVIVQIAVHVKNKENSLEFDSTMKAIIKKSSWISLINITGIITIGIIIGEKIYNSTSIDWILWKYTGIYLFIICIVFYCISRSKQIKEL